MRRNAMNVTIKELVNLVENLLEQVGKDGVDIYTSFSIPIIAPNDINIKDSWRFENQKDISEERG